MFCLFAYTLNFIKKPSPQREMSFLAVMLAVSVAVVVLQNASGFTLTLERANHAVELNQLQARDRLRHASIPPIIEFPVRGNYDPYHVGLYFTRVQLGWPPKEYSLHVDTGSDALWVNCRSCDSCPTSSGLPITLHFYDPSRSSTSSLINCSDRRCSLGNSTCSGSNKKCSYMFQYDEDSGTSGYYVSDQIQLDTNASASIVFGCSMSRTGYLTSYHKALDGIFGFGQQALSVISQLSSQGVAPNSFSHCLVGNGTGGGILVLGQIVEPNMVYTPLIPSRKHYNVNLVNISVNGHTLSIDPSVFAKSGTIIDSGTNLAYITEKAFDPLYDAITLAVSHSIQAITVKGSRCYSVAFSTIEIFPIVNLTFDGGASVVFTPQDYLVLQTIVGPDELWCLGFQKMPGQGTTILGDLVLKDKVVVYDVGDQRIGWANYDCTSTKTMYVNVSIASSGGRRKYINTGQSSGTHWSMTLVVCFFLAFWV